MQREQTGAQPPDPAQGARDAPSDFEMYRLYLGTAEKTSDRRASANAWMLSVNTAIVALYGVIGDLPAPVAQADLPIWSWAIPAAGCLACLAWSALISGYRKLNAAKFAVLQQIERALPHQPFAEESRRYEAAGLRSLSQIEVWVPWSFAALHATLIVQAVVSALPV